MARTLKLYAPSGMSSVTVVLYAPGSDTAAETVTVTERTNAKGIYEGTLTAGAGTYDAVVFQDAGATHVGTFGYVRVLAVDPETAPVGDPHGVPDGIKLGTQIIRNNISGDSLTETVTET